MQETKIIWHNGQWLPWADAKVHILTHTLHYGGGAFEGIRFYNTEKGTAVLHLGPHIDRLLYSANALNMKLPYSKADIEKVTLELIRKNKLKEGYIRPLAFYGYGTMTVTPNGLPVELAIAVWPWGAYLPHDMVDIKTSQYIRMHPKSSVTDAKLCGHYINGILAGWEVAGTKYHEALLLDMDGYIAEGAGENIFIVKNNKIFTPRVKCILPGITRKTIFDIVKVFGVDIEEKDLTLEDAYGADEAFFTGTATEVAPIRSIDDKVIGSGKTGPVTDAVKNFFEDIINARQADFINYLTFVEK